VVRAARQQAPAGSKKGGLRGQSGLSFPSGATNRPWAWTAESGFQGISSRKRIRERLDMAAASCLAHRLCASRRALGGLTRIHSCLRELQRAGFVWHAAVSLAIQRSPDAPKIQTLPISGFTMGGRRKARCQVGDQAEHQTGKEPNGI